MPIPDDVTQEQIAEWDRIIDSDESLMPLMMIMPGLRDLARAGHWTSKRLIRGYGE